MSSGRKRTRKTQRASTKRPAKKTSRATHASRRSSPKRPAPVELLYALAKVFERRAVKWYLFGAQAVNAYGVPRMTADVDVTAAIPRSDLRSLLSALSRAKFIARVEDIEAFADRTRVLPFFHAPTGMPLDLVLAGDGLEALFLERAQPIDVGGFEVPVLAIEDLIVAKILAGRARDLEDVRRLLMARGDIDCARIAALLVELDELLERADLLPVFERLVLEVEKN